MIKYREFLDLVENATGVKPTHTLISSKLGGKPTAGALSNRYFNDGFLRNQELLLLAAQFPMIDFSNYIEGNFEVLNQHLKSIETIEIKKSNDNNSEITPEVIIEETKEKAVTIPYWNDCEVNSEKIINPCFSELQLDLQKIIHVYKANYENLRTIAMPGDEMDGGATPLRNNDMLVIDISINDTSSTGVYFCKNNSSIFVRRIVELVGEGIYISVDNPIYSDILNGKMTYKELEDVGFKIIGKVIGNESWKL